MSNSAANPAIVDFWRNAGPAKWFAKDTAFDAALCERFLDVHFAAARREHEALIDDADGALALILLLDQVPRNLFRDSGHAFATDALARAYAERAIAAGSDLRVDPTLRIFFYLPFEHSESMADQDRAVTLIAALGDANYLQYAEAHRDAIRRFGRFPHRNAALGARPLPRKRPGSTQAAGSEAVVSKATRHKAKRWRLLARSNRAHAILSHRIGPSGAIF
jgi:uncharacterized protein (DUF924 family)